MKTALQRPLLSFSWILGLQCKPEGTRSLGGWRVRNRRRFRVVGVLKLKVTAARNVFFASFKSGWLAP